MSNDNSRSSSQSIFVEAPTTHHHPTHKDSDSLLFASNALITEIRVLTTNPVSVEKAVFYLYNCGSDD
jgi:hypothetical protein